MTLVIDASVACKWFIEEEGSSAALEAVQSNEGLIAPDLIVAEVCNTVWKKLRGGQVTESQAEAAVESVGGFFDDLVPAAELAEPSFAIARSLDHPVYDCLYLALAERRDARLLSADRRLLGRLENTDWAGRAISLETYRRA